MGAGDALARARTTARPWARVQLGFFSAVCPTSFVVAATLLATDGPAAGAPLWAVIPVTSCLVAVAPLYVVLFLARLCVRITVTPAFVYVQRGPFLDRIPLAKVMSAVPEDSARMALEGYGRRGLRLRVAGGASSRDLRVPCEHPETILSAIERARRHAASAIREANEGAAEGARAAAGRVELEDSGSEQVGREHCRVG